MAYDNSSLNGDIICEDYYDVSNNLMNPESPVGYFLYKVIGGAFDELDKLVNQFRIDLSILDCNVGSNQVVKDVPEIFEDNKSPLLEVVTAMYGFLTNLIQDKKLKPIKSVDEIIEFMIATYQGIQTGYVLSGSYDSDELGGKYDPCKMFSCMAESIILMMGGR